MAVGPIEVEVTLGGTVASVERTLGTDVVVTSQTTTGPQGPTGSAGTAGSAGTICWDCCPSACN